MLLGYADIEEAIGEAGLEREQARRARHGGRDGDDASVTAGRRHERLGEGLRVPGRHPRRRACHRVEDRRVVQALLVVVLGEGIALALAGEDVDDDGAVELGRLAQDVFHLGDVVSVDGAHVTDAEGLEEVLGAEHLPEGGSQALHAGLQVLTDDRDLAEDALGPLAAANVGGARTQAGDARGQPGDGGGVGPAVVVEDDQHATAAVAEVVEGLVRHAAGHRAVADDRDDAPVVGLPDVQRGGDAVGV